jgi:hypothetical protein
MGAKETVEEEVAWGTPSGGRRRGHVATRGTGRTLGCPILIACHSSSFLWCCAAPQLPPLPSGG